jgi:glycosyltransferase involved in cell wall biosynthesis
MLSIIIPSFKDPLLHKTIDDLLQKARGEIEIIAVLDGYWPETPVINHPNVRVLHLGKNRGMRGAINAGVLLSGGKYLMRVDEHQMFGERYDVILTDSCRRHYIVTPRRYFLDTDKWEVMDIPPVDYMKLEIVKYGRGRKFSGTSWPYRTIKRKHASVDETMAMQGSCWVMRRSWWDRVIGELQSEGYGTHYQDSHEMVFKTWQAGGRLMVNKNTWHAHKHRKFPRTHSYGGKLADDCFKYSLDTWKDYYEEEVKPRFNI